MRWAQSGKSALGLRDKLLCSSRWFCRLIGQGLQTAGQGVPMWKNTIIIFEEIFWLISKLESGSSDDGKGRTGTRIPAFKSINHPLTITASFEILRADQADVMVKHHRVIKLSLEIKFRSSEKWPSIWKQKLFQWIVWNKLWELFLGTCFQLWQTFHFQWKIFS